MACAEGKPVHPETPIQIEYMDPVVSQFVFPDFAPPPYLAKHAAQFLGSGRRVWDVKGQELKLKSWDSDEVVFGPVAIEAAEIALRDTQWTQTEVADLTEDSAVHSW